MAEPLRHRQTKEAETDMFSLQPPRHISTLHFSDISGLAVDVRRSVSSGLNARGAFWSVHVQGFGCRPCVDGATSSWAGVRKPPRKEPAGDGARKVPRTRLWGFG